MIKNKRHSDAATRLNKVRKSYKEYYNEINKINQIIATRKLDPVKRLDLTYYRSRLSDCRYFITHYEKEIRFLKKEIDEAQISYSKKNKKKSINKIYIIVNNSHKEGDIEVYPSIEFISGDRNKTLDKFEELKEFCEETKGSNYVYDYTLYEYEDSKYSDKHRLIEQCTNKEF